MKKQLMRFSLEDFFDEYEHRPKLINLASSDAHPWSVDELAQKGVRLDTPLITSLHYPDVKAQLIPALRKFCQPPEDFDVLPTSGAAEAIALLMHDHAARGGQRHKKLMAIPRPAYGAFNGLAKLLGVPTATYNYAFAQDWALDVNAVIELAGRCDALVLTNPHNPSGNVIAPGAMEKISQAMANSDGLLIVDEVFRMEDDAPPGWGFQPGLALIGSLSKVYGLPGLRLGWITASVERIQRLRTVQQLLTLVPSATAVSVGGAVLADLPSFSRSDLIRGNRKILSDWASKHARHVSISTPAGGTTVCMKMLAGGNEEQWFQRFLQHNVLLAPGKRCFEIAMSQPWFRLGYGTGTSALQEGLDRLDEVFQASTGNPT